MRSDLVRKCLMSGLLVAGCVSEPAPIVIHEDARDSVWLMFDPGAKPGHSHPASVTPEQMFKVLSGVRIRGRDVIVGFGAFADKDGAPAFAPGEIVRLAPYLSEALSKASPKDMATFYLIVPDPNQGSLITSGGLYVRDQRMYFILANARTSPSSIQYENTYEIDTRGRPLLPIARYKFTVGFTPHEALVPKSQARRTEGYEGYVDESKVLVIDLQRLFAGAPLSPPGTAPSSRQPRP